MAWGVHLQLWHLYAMTLITGTGSAMYWATVNALVQEVIPPSQFTGANAAVLVGVQSGMLIAGAFVGFLYNTAGIEAILAILRGFFEIEQHRQGAPVDAVGQYAAHERDAQDGASQTLPRA